MVSPPLEDDVELPVVEGEVLLVDGEVLLVEGDVLLVDGELELELDDGELELALDEGDAVLLEEDGLAALLLLEGVLPLVPLDNEDEELELLPGATLRLLSIEVLLEDDEGLVALGAAALPDEFRSSVELLELLVDGAVPIVAPGTTVVPVTESLVTALPLAEAAGTLGMQPTGLVFAASMHLGSSCTLLL